MKKKNNVIDYYNGIASYNSYFNHNMGNTKLDDTLIRNSNSVKYAIVSLIVNFFLLKKEEIVENKGNLNYESKLLDDNLEKVIELIAPKNGDMYKLDSYETENPATIIALIRNKFAHGDYYIDIDNDYIIFNKDDKEVKISINDLRILVSASLTNLIRNKKTDSIERLILENTAISRTNIKQITNRSQLMEVIKHTRLTYFNLKSLDGKPIRSSAIKGFLAGVQLYKKLISNEKDTTVLFNQFEEKASREKLIFNKRKMYIKNKSEIDKIISILENDEFFYSKNYYAQIGEILSVAQDIRYNSYNNESLIMGNYINIRLLSYMLDNNIYDYKTIINNNRQLMALAIFNGSEQFVSNLLGEFNSLYCYPIEDIYRTNKYNINRDNEFDFSKLDLSHFNPSVLEIDTNFLEEVSRNLEGALKDKNRKYEEYIKEENNLNNAINATDKVKNAVKNILKIKYNAYITANEKYDLIKLKYDLMLNDYQNNSAYFENRAIIEGIRNSIAHGNVKVIKYNGQKIKGNVNDDEILFTNIYDGKKCFELKIRIDDFETLFYENNVNILNDYLSNNEDKQLVK